MKPDSSPDLAAPRRPGGNALTRGVAGVLGLSVLALIAIACLGSLPYTLGAAPADASGAPTGGGTPRYKLDSPGVRLPPWWVTPDPEATRRLNAMVPAHAVRAIASKHGLDPAAVVALTTETTGNDSNPGLAFEELKKLWPRYWLGTDFLGRSLLIRLLTGGGVSLGIGLAAAFISVLIGTLYGAFAGFIGGKTDAVMMRIVDVLFGLPYVLLVVLIAVASDAALDEFIGRGHARTRWVEQQAARDAADRGLSTDRNAVRGLLDADAAFREDLENRALTAVPARVIGEGRRALFDVATLLVAIGGVSWLTMARVVRGQVLSLKAQPFMEAARAIGLGWSGQFFRHLLPNLVGPIVVYATLTVPQAILQESFLSFLGIGVKPPLPSWGNLAADGLAEVNPYKSHWWLLFFPCAALGLMLLALNFVGEGLREAIDPKRSRR
ncbi:MAG: ABC transporter permease [Phycisphaerales bacterium]